MYDLMKTIIRVSFKGECDGEILPVFNYLNFLSLFGSMELIWTIVSVSQLEKPSLHAWLFIYQFLKNFNVKIVEYLLPISKLNKPVCWMSLRPHSLELINCLCDYWGMALFLKHCIQHTIYEDLAAKCKLLELLSILWLLIYSWFTTVFMNLAID